MSEKERVTVDFDSESYYLDGEYWESWDNYGEEMADAINKEFNKLSEENEQLKQEYNKLKHRHSLLHDDCIEAEFDRDSYHKDVLSLEKENEQLKQEISKQAIDLDFLCAENKHIKDVLEENKHKKERIKELEAENEQLKNKIDVLEDDNETYYKSLEQLNLYTKRFIPTKCTNEFQDCKTNRYYWLDNEGNFEGCLELLNLLDCEIESLKFENRELKGRLMLYREQFKGDFE